MGVQPGSSLFQFWQVTYLDLKTNEQHIKRHIVGSQKSRIAVEFMKRQKIDDKWRIMSIDLE
jgi:hypothetical protein